MAETTDDELIAGSLRQPELFDEVFVRRAPGGRRLVLLTPVVLIASGATAMALGVGVPNLDPADPDSGIGCSIRSARTRQAPSSSPIPHSPTRFARVGPSGGRSLARIRSFRSRASPY